MSKQMNRIKGTATITGHSAVTACTKHVFTKTLALRTVKLPWWSVP